ncbi:glyoxalase [Enterococcus sp. AZ103]|uniref:glyoxalase n=1 Tax=Enterococcus sp. AZ103 TaxID=2774628 RepID=UPI003F1F697F
MKKIRIMFCVQNVETISQFWQEKLGAELIENQPLPKGLSNAILKISGEIEFVIFPRDFIAEVSPEVLDSTPSLMLYREDFEELHERLNPSAELMTVDQTATFNFTDPEGNYFVIAKA